MVRDIVTGRRITRGCPLNKGKLELFELDDYMLEGIGNENIDCNK